MEKVKKFIPLIILIFFIGVVTLFKLSNTFQNKTFLNFNSRHDSVSNTNPEANLKQIISDEGGYSIDYPNTWEIATSTSILPSYFSNSEFILKNKDNTCAITFADTNINYQDYIQRNYSHDTFDSNPLTGSYNRVVKKTLNPEATFIGDDWGPYISNEIAYVKIGLFGDYDRYLILYPLTSEPINKNCNDDFINIAGSAKKYLQPTKLDKSSKGILTIYKTDEYPRNDTPGHIPETYLLFQEDNKTEKKLVTKMDNFTFSNHGIYAVNNDSIYYYATTSIITSFNFFTGESINFDTQIKPIERITSLYPLGDKIYYLVEKSKGCYPTSAKDWRIECIMGFYYLDKNNKQTHLLKDFNSPVINIIGRGNGKLYLYGEPGGDVCGYSYYSYDLITGDIDELVKYKYHCTEEGVDVSDAEFAKNESIKNGIEKITENQLFADFNLDKGIISPKIYPDDYIHQSGTQWALFIK